MVNKTDEITYWNVINFKTIINQTLHYHSTSELVCLCFGRWPSFPIEYHRCKRRQSKVIKNSKSDGTEKCASSSYQWTTTNAKTQVQTGDRRIDPTLIVSIIVGTHFHLYFCLGVLQLLKTINKLIHSLNSWLKRTVSWIKCFPYAGDKQLINVIY